MREIPDDLCPVRARLSNMRLKLEVSKRGIRGIVTQLSLLFHYVLGEFVGNWSTKWRKSRKKN
jgi:hypothetical protein